jgi:hypothetical protein
MGNNTASASRVEKVRVVVGLLGTLFFFLIPAVSVEAGLGPVEAGMQSTAQRYIDSFRQGGDMRVYQQIGTLVTAGHVKKTELTLLTQELASGTTAVREMIVRLLEKTGLELDSHAEKKLPIIRDRSIIRALVVEGFAKPDSAARSASKILRERCKASDLALFTDVYLASLQRQRVDYLYIVAKAKTLQASRLVDDLAELPVSQDDAYTFEKIKITQAALGNHEIEGQYITATMEAERNAPPAPKNRFYNTGAEKDGEAVAKQIAILGLIGTRNALSVVCSYLRTPLKTYVPNYSERSIRYDALDAIRYNYPDERVLVDPANLREWTAVEQFCSVNIGAVFDGPTPEIEPDKLYPTRISH